AQPAPRPGADSRRPVTPPPVATQPGQAPPAARRLPAPIQNGVPNQPAPEQPAAEPKGQPVPVNEVGGGFPWYYGVPVALFALLVFAWFRQRRHRSRAIHEATAVAEEERVARAVETARPEPLPRP